MNSLIEHQVLTQQVSCDSAGTGGYHIGSPPDRRMTAAAELRDIHLCGKARQFNPADFERFDLILAMDQDNYHNILLLDTAKIYRHKVFLMCDFCTRHTDREVPDPYYGGAEGFNYVIDLLMDACEGLLDKVINDRALVADR